MIPLKVFRKILFSSHYNGTPCWIWKGAINKGGGYGYVYTDKKMKLVHRVVYELLVGPIPEGLQLDHLCRNRACCNPAHLEPVTQQENIRRGNGLKATLERHQKYRQRTHCANGHEYTPENTYNYTRDGSNCRSCKQCIKENLIKSRNNRRGRR